MVKHVIRVSPLPRVVLCLHHCFYSWDSGKGGPREQRGSRSDAEYQQRRWSPCLQPGDPQRCLVSSLSSSELSDHPLPSSRPPSISSLITKAHWGSDFSPSPGAVPLSLGLPHLQGKLLPTCSVYFLRWARNQQGNREEFRQLVALQPHKSSSSR